MTLGAAGQDQDATDSGDIPRTKGAARLWPIRRLLFALVGIVALPLICVIFAAIFSLQQSADRAQRAALQYSAQSIAEAVDAELSKLMALGEALARSPTLLTDDVAGFDAEARRVVSGADGAWVVLSTLDGRQLLNTSVAFGAPLPPRSAAGLRNQRLAALERRSVVGSVVKGLVQTSQWIVTVETPVFRDGAPRYGIAITIPTSTFLKFLGPKTMPGHWLSGIMDRNGIYVARIPGGESLSGAPASEGWRATSGADGLFEFDSREGDATLNANSHSRLSGWTIGVAARKSQIQAEALKTIAWASALALSVAALSLLLAFRFARWLTGSITGLESGAAALLHDATPTFSTRILELAGFWTTLKQAVGERERTSQSLRESEARLRQAAAAAQFGIHQFDPATRVMTWSPELYRLLGLPASQQPSSETLLAVVDPAQRAKLREEFARICRRVGPYEFEFRIVRADGEQRWMLDRGESVGPLDPQTGFAARVTGTMLDITERKFAEQRNEHLMREVNHRTKNQLAVVAAIARRTSAASVSDFVAQFSRRIRALAANQDLLVTNQWRGVWLRQLILAHIEPFADLQEGRVAIEGPDLLVTPDAAQSIGMAIHELATNATKYGALSNAKGRVRIELKIAGTTLSLEWREMDGPQVAPPTREGFGSTVLTSLTKTGVAGDVSMAYEPQGVVWRLKCPLAAVSSSEA
ncbi:MAG: PAS domain S-box protein [Hyphomicrobiales bacterium]|nr:PAS domain S-box protein [Hyphomicrobiales bacterium]